MTAFIDKYLNFTISKKLTVFIISCIALFSGKVDGQQWMVIAGLYLGIQGGLDAFLQYLKR